MQHVLLFPGSEVNNAFLSLKFSHSAKGMKYAKFAAKFPDLWQLVNVHEFEKNIPYILFNIMCDHATNLSTI